MEVPQRRRRASATWGWIGLLLVSLLVLLVAGGPSEADGATGQVADVATGEQVYAANCAECHGADARGTGAAPALIGVFERHTRDEIEAVIREGRDVSPPMPAFENVLSGQEIDDVIAYLETFPAEVDDDAVAPPRSRGMPHMDGRWGRMMDGWWGWGLGAVLWILVVLALLALLITGIVWLIRSMTSGDRGPPPQSGRSNREFLDARYARGEIDREQYLQARRDLGDPVE